MSEAPELRNSQPRIPFLARFFATGFFAGYSPVVPGTAGSLVGLIIYAVVRTDDAIVFAVLTLIAFIIGVFTSSKMEKHLGDDPPVVVIDEIVGMWISLFLLPKSLSVALSSFVLFRVYDIVKPPPARQLEHLMNGWGIMLDDVAAGIYANLTVRLVLLIFPKLV